MNIWRKFLAFVTAFALSTSAMAGGTGPTVFEPFIWTNNGSSSAPAHSFVNEPGTGFYRAAAGQLYTSILGVPKVGIFTGSFQLDTSHAFAWASGTVGTSSDLTIYRDAADVLAQRRGTNAQTFRLYNTYTDASNYERLNIGSAGTFFQINTANAGTGTARALRIGTDGAALISLYTSGITRWQISSVGHFIANLDNTYDIGDNGINRPRVIYAGTQIQTPNEKYTTAYTVATLPTCNAGAAGTRAYVTDATAPTFLTALVGGGAVVSPAFCNGTTWVAG